MQVFGDSNLNSPCRGRERRVAIPASPRQVVGARGIGGSHEWRLLRVESGVQINISEAEMRRSGNRRSRLSPVPPHLQIP